MSVKIRRGDFTTYTRQRRLGPATQDTGIVAAAARSLLEQWLATQPNAAVRLLGVGVGDLQTLRQADLLAGAVLRVRAWTRPSTASGTDSAPPC